MARAMLRGGRRYRTRRRRWIGPLLALLVVLALSTVASYYIWFFPKHIEEVVYPLAYVDLIDQYATTYALDPARVAAVIYCESSFQPEAVSSAGAVGLMQIMPQTGKWVAEKLGEGDYQLQKLTDPETNIRYGCWYLNYLNGRFDEDMTKVTAAYHAGGGRVNEWLEDEANSQDGEKLSYIPSDVTRAYVKNVYAAYEKYKEIMSA
ncbi:MAG: lytic transglycosylase domain-containing protein [Clostridia bacterium]